jgi:uncharacterized protein
MALSLYDFCIPQALRMLDNMSTIIDMAIAHCAARKIDPAVVVNFRLAPDMHPFSRQIQIMCDQAARLAARVAGLELPSHPDTETTLEELKARIAKSKAYVQSVKPEQFAGCETRPIVMKVPATGQELKFANGAEYAITVFFPNFYFHATTAYDILRHLGLEVGKRHFVGA